MALSKTIETKFGVVVENTYIRVETITLKSKSEMIATARYYADKDKDSFESQEHSMRYDLEQSNPIKQAYEYLKTLPEFAGATDV